MSGPRIKIIIIATLALINAFFIALIVADAVGEARTERETLANVSAIMRAGGVEIDPGVIRAAAPARTAGGIRAMRTARVLEVEENIARAFLGPASMTDQGVIYLYESAGRGAAEFASAGDFQIRMDRGAITDEGGFARTVAGLLKEMKVETSEPVVSQGAIGGAATVTVVCAYRSVNIFNCAIEFVFGEGSLQVVNGRYVAGIEPTEGGKGISQVGTALLIFLAEVMDAGREDVACARIFGVEAGYRHSVSGSFGEGVITPAWLITTDNGRYLIDDTTGEVWGF